MILFFLVIIKYIWERFFVRLKIMNQTFYYFVTILMIYGSIIFAKDCFSKGKLFTGISTLQQSGWDLVNGNLIQFNNNGAWCWYQDERAIVDQEKNKLIIGSLANKSGVGGSPRDGDVEVNFFDLYNRYSSIVTLKKNLISYGAGDDHNAPALLLLPDGAYLVMYAGHNNDNYSFYRIYNDNNWSTEQSFDWSTIPGGTDFATTYSNLFYLENDKRLYNIVRGYARSPNMMVSNNMGSTWSYGGLITEPDITIGYVNGYFKYSSNGIDRIDFICTEHHPRDYNTSIYHGYLKNGQSFKSDGTLMDSDISDKFAPKPADFTKVFATNTVVRDTIMTRCWTIDLQIYQDNTIATIFKARANNSETDHRFFYSRFNGTNWITTYLGKAGSKLYNSEQDYTGLGALDPNNPEVLYISTTFDPTTNENLGIHEIFKGTTEDNGLSWSWTAITQRSIRDNLRPIVPAWDKDHTALLWWRGTYNSSQNFDAAVVGIIESSSDIFIPMHYMDAGAANTKFSDGTPLTFTGPDSGKGATDNQWHLRIGYGNGGNVLTSAEAEGEDAPVLKTTVSVNQAGVYDVWVNFWANPEYDWRIKAGFSINKMQLFRQMACQQVKSGSHDVALVLTGGGNTFLYQAYLGRIRIIDDCGFEVFVDDEAIQTGTENTQVGDIARTWYDGISYNRLEDLSITRDLEGGYMPEGFTLEQNYPNPFNSATTITFSLLKHTHINLKIYNILGQEIATLVNQEMNSGIHRISWKAQNLSSGIYFYKLTGSNFSQVKKMVLLQ
jgi:hypothetical protein